MKRRTFLEKTAAYTALTGIGGLALGSCKRRAQKHITILHTNDVHSHIDPFPPGHANFAGKGGIARRASLVEKIREENPNTLLFDAGDIFQGTPYFNFYGGELEFKLMSMLRYDAATIGNHDFDNGIDGLLAQLPYAKFQLLSANYDFRNTVMDGFVKPYTVFERSDVRIGVFGLGIKLKGLVPERLYKETRYLDPVEMATDMSRTLREVEKCDLVICLSHLGYAYDKEPGIPSDVLLAAKTDGIDLIIGGHTHTFLERPVIHKNRLDQDVIINQVGCYGVYLGRIDFYFDAGSRLSSDGIQIEV